MQALIGWMIAMVGSRTFVGRESTPGSMSPVFDLQSGFAMTERGMSRPCMAAPVLGLASIESLKLPPDAIVIDCSTLSRADQEAIGKAIEMGKQLQAQMRAAEAGVVLAGPDKVRGVYRSGP